MLAAIPTVEGLFRNSNNADVDTDTIVIRVKVEKKAKETLIIGDENKELEVTKEGESSNVEKLPTEVTDKKESPIYLKLIFEQEDKKPIKLLQVVYENSQMTKEAIIKADLFKNLNELTLKDQNSERVLIYSLLTMFGLNTSEIVSSLLKKHNVDYRSNKEMLDPEKHELMRKYKGYLEAVKKDDAIKDSLNSPLESEDEVEKEKLKEIMKRRMYLASNQVRLIRESGKFYWRVKLENLEARFSNVEQNLLNIMLNTPNGQIQSTVSDYVLLDGSHELPKNIIIKDIIDNTFHFQILSFSSFNSKNKTINQRYQEYLEMLQKSEVKSSESTNSYFIY